MPGFIAKKLCPDLVIIPLNFDKYKKVCQAFYSLRYVCILCVHSQPDQGLNNFNQQNVCLHSTALLFFALVSSFLSVHKH